MIRRYYLYRIVSLSGFDSITIWLWQHHYLALIANDDDREKNKDLRFYFSYLPSVSWSHLRSTSLCSRFFRKLNNSSLTLTYSVVRLHLNNQRSLFWPSWAKGEVIKRKIEFFLLYCLRFALTLAVAEDRLHLNNKKKKWIFSFVLSSVCTNFICFAEWS